MTRSTVSEPLCALPKETRLAVIDGVADPLKRQRFIDALDHYFGGSMEGFLFASINALNHAYEDGVELPAPTRFAPIGQGR
jgi:hypothetical protein